MRIKEWLQAIVADPAYYKLIWWHDETRALIAIHWKHASYDDYDERDSALFKQWAIANNRYDHSARDTPEEQKRWKTNFRCALHSATNIRKGQAHHQNKNDKRASRVYELLDKPDPQKLREKKKSNKRAAASKLKPDNKKRMYNSRLNRIKVEPSSHRMLKRRNRSKQSKRIPGNVLANVLDTDPLESNAKEAKHPQPQSYHNSNIELSKMSAEELPATLEDLHEDEREDCGYCSASDSVQSQDSARTERTCEGHIAEEESNIPLDSIDTIFIRKYSGVHEYDHRHYEYEMDKGGVVYDDWGSVIVQEITTSPNVVTQFYAEQSNIKMLAVSHNNECQFEDGYSLTML